ncbi:MAG: hypothetical protein MJZ41_13750 [Bacteroidaceae bacterium]|nr:hypothetical protein [Bacteroidaceae bacterium]
MDFNQFSHEKIDSPTPNGGAYSIAYFYDADGNPCDKSHCTKIEIIEFSDSGDFLCSTIMLKEK